MIRYLEKRLQTVFNLMFVLMEDQSIEWNQDVWRWTVLWNALDFFQILRTAVHPEYGWSSEPLKVLEKFDLFYWITFLASKVVPVWSFFVLAAVVYILMIADFVYAYRLFHEGDLQKLWPLAVVRHSRKYILSIFFVGILRWLLIPMDCLITDYYNFSEDVHSIDHECSPFQVPEIVATATSIIVTVLVVLLAYWSHYFDFTVNILSRTSNAIGSGRVELHFLMLKVFVLFLPYVAQYITSTAVTVILTLFSFTLVYRHSQVLPFHHHPTNVLRGGIYASLVWIFLSCVLVTVIENSTLQWIFLAVVPLAFLMGMALTHRSRQHQLLDIDRLRGEWEDLQAAAMDHTEHTGGSSEDGKGSHRVSVRKQQQGRARSAKQKGFEYFFDPSFERKRAFLSGRHALACMRALLYEKDKDDIPFMQSLTERGLSEFPRFRELHMFNLLLKIYVFNKAAEVSVEQKKMRSNQESLPLDLRFTLYAIERQGLDASEAKDVGKDGGQSAKNLMEYRTGMKQAKEAHMSAIQAMKKFWATAAKSDSKTQMGDMVRYLENFQKAEVVASKAYTALLYKYPTSIELLYSWATFADSVLNDPNQADDSRKKAREMQDDDEELQEDMHLDIMEEIADKSSGSGGTSSSENKRTKAVREANSWRSQIMMSQEHDLKVLSYKILVTVGFMLLVATVSFVVSDFILFKTLAKQEMEMIIIVGDMRTSVVSITFWIRELVLAAWTNDRDKFQRVQESGHNLVKHIAEENFFIRNHAFHGEANLYFNHHAFKTAIPYRGEWRTQDMTLWELGNDFARRADLAFTSTFEELRSINYILENITDHKRGIPFVYENFFRSVAPAYGGLEDLYVHEMEMIQGTTDILVSVTSCANAVLVIMISFFLWNGLVELVGRLEYKSTVVFLALSMPRPTKKKLAKFYGAHEKKLVVLEDEDAEKEELMATDDRLLGDDGREGEDTTVQGTENGATTEGSFSQHNPHKSVLKSAFHFEHRGGEAEPDESKQGHAYFARGCSLPNEDDHPNRKPKSANGKHRHIALALPEQKVESEVTPVDLNEPADGTLRAKGTVNTTATEHKDEEKLLRSPMSRESSHDTTNSGRKASSIFGSSFFKIPWFSASSADNRTAIHERGRRGSSEMVGDFIIRDARMDQVIVRSINDIMKSKRSWFNKKSVYAVIMASLLLLGVMSSAFPARNLPNLITLAPIVNQAGRRVELFRALISYAREVIMDDGLSRHSVQELSNAMKWLIDDLYKTDKAIRLGNSLGIGKGADDRNEEHNAIMYTGVCPWKADASDCTIEEKPAASGRGLLYLMNSFLDAAESVLAIYGVWPHGDLEAFEHPRPEGHDDNGVYDFLHINPERYANLTNDANMVFMEKSFNGNLYQGLHYTEQLFNHEMDRLLEKGVEENDILFSFFVLVLTIGFYMMTFRRSIQWGHWQIQRARETVMQIPFVLLNENERTVIKEHFVPVEDALEDDGDFLTRSESRG